MQHRGEFIAFASLGIAIGPALCGCGSEVMARLLGGSDTPESPPIDVQAWSDSGEADLPLADSPFGPARRVDVAKREGLWVQTEIAIPGDTRTYSLGTVSVGDRITIQAVPNSTSRLDPVVAVFDANMNWLHYNDDRHYYDRQIDSLVDFKPTKTLEECFVVVTSSPRSESTGYFDLYVSKDTGYASTPARKQTVYLQFSGQANVVVGRRNPVNVPEFRGALIAPEFDADTQTLIKGIVARVREDFAQFNVTVLSSQWSARPFTPHTTVYFGSLDPALLGISDNIDANNELDMQEAIVFVDSFALFMPASPSVEELVDVLANVASHEIGHLLGLHHTADPSEIMDTTATLTQMLEQQSFHRAPLHEGTFLVGYQDPQMRLLRNVGAAPTTRVRDQTEPLEIETDPEMQPGIPARSFRQFGTACAASLQ